jgi:hypothetical protein
LLSIERIERALFIAIDTSLAPITDTTSFV